MDSLSVPTGESRTHWVPEEWLSSEIPLDLQRGTLLKIIFPNCAPLECELCLDRSVFQVKIKKKTSGVPETIDISDIKEIRSGQTTKDFELCKEVCAQDDCCFALLYGRAFNLSTLSCEASTPDVAQLWMKTLEKLTSKHLCSRDSEKIERFLRRQFLDLCADKGLLIQEMVAFCRRINARISAERLYNLTAACCPSFLQTKRLNYRDFRTVYYHLFRDDFVEPVFRHHLQFYFGDQKFISKERFTAFLLEEQQDLLAALSPLLARRDVTSMVSLPVLTGSIERAELMDFLFSKQNSIFNPVFGAVHQNMDQPLAHYWIASSHNTYLTGNQITSESSVEAYIRCLRSGCRCVELDTWDGSDGYPDVKHAVKGVSATPAVKLREILVAIREHGFVASEFPVILSFEDHCCIKQQDIIADMLRTVFGKLLVTEPFAEHEDIMPSPNQLRRRVLVKHKTIPTYEDEELSRTTHFGEMQMQEKHNSEWKRQYFVLHKNHLYYMDPIISDDSENSQHSSDNQQQNNKEGALYKDEKWYHGKIPGGAEGAAQLLRETPELPDGAFLVRESITKCVPCISFLTNRRVFHGEICDTSQQANIPDPLSGELMLNRFKEYYLNPSEKFPSVFDLIEYYRSHAFCFHVKTEPGVHFNVILTHPVNQPDLHLDKQWFYGQLTRTKAEHVLFLEKGDGTFLVRNSERSPGSLVISFYAEEKVFHCQIRHDNRLYVIESPENRNTIVFENMDDLLCHYTTQPLYHTYTLKRWLEKSKANEFLGLIASSASALTTRDHPYVNINLPVYADIYNYILVPISCRAICDYRSTNSDELDFSINDLITNVKKECSARWRGDCNEKFQLAFPPTHVKEMKPGEKSNQSSDLFLGPSQRGAIDITHVALQKITASRLWNQNGIDKNRIFKLVTTDEKFLFRCDSRETRREWVQAIQRNRKYVAEKEKRQQKISKKISDLTVYFHSGAEFSLEKPSNNYREMTSFVSSIVQEYIGKENCQRFLKYHRTQFSRIYPAWNKILSDNYHPMAMWLSGCQMVALNYQKSDEPMQLNHGKFLQNGGCGYVLQPEFMRNDNYHPFFLRSIPTLVPILFSITVIAGRHLPGTRTSTINPFVEVEIIGATYDCSKQRTEHISANGLNPSWNKVFDFVVCNPDVALIRFVVRTINLFDLSEVFLAQATFPISCIRQGIRSVFLKNAYSEEIELASLLVKISRVDLKGKDPDVYYVFRKLRQEANEISQHHQKLLDTNQIAEACLVQHKKEEIEREVARKSKDWQQTLYNVRQRAIDREISINRYSRPMRQRKSSEHQT